MEVYNLINSEQERIKYKKLATIYKSTDDKKFVELFQSDNHLIFYKLSKGNISDTENQTEIPISSIAWLTDSIVNGFWRKPSEGGFPKEKHTVVNTFADEEILIGRSMNAGAYLEKGFKIVNKSRSSHILSFRPQELQITDEQLQKIVLPIFRMLLA